MFVRDRMSVPARTIRASQRCREAFAMLRRHRIRHLPVVDDEDRLLGILGVHDLAFLSEQSEVDPIVSTVMHRNPATIAPGDTVEVAARRMYIDRLGALPVVEGGRVVGMITQSDIFKVFLELMGIAEGARRLSVELADEPGSLHALTGVIMKYGVNIVSIVTVPNRDRPTRTLVVRVNPPLGDSLDDLIEGLDAAGYRPVLESQPS